MRVGGQLRIEDQMPRQLAVLALPEVDEAEDLLGLLAFAEIGVGVAEGAAVGVLGEEGEDAGLGAAAAGDVVALRPADRRRSRARSGSRD